MKDPTEGSCFGFYAGSMRSACAQCTASRRCKAILASDGFEIMADLVSALERSLPKDKQFDLDAGNAGIRALVDVLIRPGQSVLRPPNMVGVPGLAKHFASDGLDLGDL